MSASSYLGSRSAPIRAVLDWSPRTRTTSLNSLDLVEARAASRVEIARSSRGITCKVTMQTYIRMEMSVALEKVIGCSDQSRCFGSEMGPSYVATNMMRRAMSFCSRLSSEIALPPKMVAMVLVGSWYVGPLFLPRSPP